MLARNEERSSDEILMATSRPLEVILAPLPPGRVEKSGDSAAEMQAATLADLSEITISAVKLIEVNVIRPRRHLEIALRALPYSKSYSSEPLRPTGRTPAL